MKETSFQFFLGLKTLKAFVIIRVVTIERTKVCQRTMQQHVRL